MNIIKGPAEVTRMIKKCINQEITPEGLLRCVTTFVPSYRMEEELEEPLIWLFEHETTVADGKSGRLSRKLLLTTPYEFIGKNISRLNEDNNVILENLKFDALYPVGTVQVAGKSNKAPATSIRLNVEYYVDWAMCCQRNFKI